MDSYERYLRERLIELHNDYLKKAQPYLDDLVKIEARKPTPPAILDLATAPQWVLDKFDDLTDGE